jgi:NAD(P)-dependent dehydrogenase (short-subunit alcohol dehydrogenase family)
MQNLPLQGLNALVIGGTSGIGNHIAHGLQDAGARVGIVGRAPEKLDGAVKKLQAQDAKARGYACDASSNKDLDALLASVLKDFGHIDILVPAQGTTIIKPAEDFSEDEFDRIMNTNMRSVFFACTKIGAHMLSRGSGVIINIASLAAHRGWARSSVYCVSKHGVLGLTHSLASEWAERGVRVNAISPGFFMTDLNRNAMSPERKALALGRTPMRRFGELPELVGAAVYLASPGSAFVTGTVINVDGGYLAAGI